MNFENYLNRFGLLLILFSVSFSLKSTAQCRLLNETFSTSPNLASTNTDGVWYPDRYRPAGFVQDAFNGGSLKISIDGINDGLNARPSGYQYQFYNTQGRKFNQCGGCVTVLKGDLYIPSSWATAHRRSDMWATGYDLTQTQTSYPIIGFRNIDGSSPGIFYWDDNVGWINTGVTISYNNWYHLGFRIVGNNLQYLVNNNVVATISSYGTKYFGDIMIQAYNFNDPTLATAQQSTDSYDAYWDNLITTGTNGNVVTNLTTGQTFCSIQTAIDAPLTVNGNTLSVGPGLYAENIIVNKTLAIVGPNANINPCSGTRVAEAVVVPAVAAISSGEVIHVAASGVTIAGLTIDGDNPALTSGFTSTNGADIDAAEGVTVYEENINNLTVTNNIIRNLSYFGVTLFGGPLGNATSGHMVASNRIENLGTYDQNSGIDLWGGGVLIYDNQYTSVIYNCMNNVRLGIQTGNFSQANPNAPGSQGIVGNSIAARRRGIFHNLAYSSAAAYNISANSITGIANVNETTAWDGMLISSLATSTFATIANNTIDGSAITAAPKVGISVWNDQSAPLISGGTISGVGLGINVNNYEGYPTTGSNALNTSATIQGVTITGASIAGIRVNDNPLNSNNATVTADIRGNTNISGSPTGILVIGSDATANIHDNNSTINANTIGIDVNAGQATINKNTISANGTGVHVSNGGRLTPTSQNFITSNTSDGIRIENTAGTIGAINSNDLSGNTGYAIKNLSTPTLAATCNWFGSIVPATVAAKISGNVTYIPYLSSGADLGADPSNGFQPSVACSACSFTATSTVSPQYPMTGQSIQTIYLNYPSSAQTETISLNLSGGTSPYAYNWTKSNCNATSLNNSYNSTNSTLTFSPTYADTCSFNGNNIVNYMVTVTDGSGCTASTSKKLNVVNPYVGTDVLVCHKVAVRGASSSQLLQVAASAVAAHLAHGDALGTCASFNGARTVAPEFIPSADQQVAIYPNPTTGVFILEISEIRDQANIQITDMQGRIIASKSLSKNDKPTATFDLNNVSRGIYLVQVQDGDFSYRSKIVLQ